MCITAAACETVRMSSSPASNQPPTSRPGIRSPGAYCVSVVGPILKPSKCWWFTGAWRASSRCGSPVPDPVRLVDEHVVHLHGEPHVERLLPGVRVGLRVDREDRRLLLAVLQEVEARAVDRREVEGRVLVAQVRAPGLDLHLQPLDGLARGRHLDDARRRRAACRWRRARRPRPSSATGGTRPARTPPPGRASSPRWCSGARTTRRPCRSPARGAACAPRTSRSARRCARRAAAGRSRTRSPPGAPGPRGRGRASCRPRSAPPRRTRRGRGRRRSCGPRTGGSASPRASPAWGPTGRAGRHPADRRPGTSSRSRRSAGTRGSGPRGRRAAPASGLSRKTAIEKPRSSGVTRTRESKSSSS